MTTLFSLKNMGFRSIVKSCLASLSNLSATHTTKGIKIILRIFDNILNKPNDVKYRNIHLKRIKTQLKNCTPCIELLYIAGFQKNANDPSRLRFDLKNTEQLQFVYSRIQKYRRKNGINTNSLNQLLQMGFSKEKAITALYLANGDTNMAVRVIFQTETMLHCFGPIQQCHSLLVFKFKLESLDDIVDLNSLLNAFHHLLHHHHTDAEFEFIYHFIGKCDIQKCTAIRRSRERYRVLNNDDCKYNHTLYDAKQQILDQIHCHYLHAYDIGYRLTNQQKVSIKYNEINKMLSNKHQLYQDIIVNTENNKFNRLKNNIKQSVLSHYSFGYQYYYWDHYKNLNETWSVILPYGDKYKDWYITPVSSTLKEELISNKICTIGIDEWNNERQKAEIKLNGDYAKTIKAGSYFSADIGEFLVNFDVCGGYTSGDTIQLNHLIAIIVYCGHDSLSFKFSETFRRLNAKETDQSLKKRHSNFYWLARYINEAVIVFGTTCSRTSAPRSLFHGVSGNMLFDSLCGCMKQPLSTTSEYAVAFSFSNYSGHSGVILNLKSNPLQRYFSCRWLSDYSNESEYLFIHSNGWKLTITNIINIVSGCDYTPFIICLSILDAMTNGMYYQNDDGNALRRFNQIDKYFSTCALVGAKPISPISKLLTIQMINHELSKYYPNKYDKYLSIPPYVDKLLHHICTKKQLVCINWRSMHVDITDDVMNVVYTGYCGYLFLKPYILCKQNNTLNFTFIVTLFPNVSSIVVNKMDSITERILSALWNFLSQNKHQQIKCIQLKFNRKLARVDLNSKKKIVQSMVLKYKQLFGIIGYKIDYIKSHNPAKTHHTEPGVTLNKI